MTIRLTLLLGALVLTACVPEPNDAPTVEANGERLVGRWDGGTRQAPVASFKGIPFAAPPVGASRWRAPQPHSPRSGDQPTFEFAPACMQGEHMTRWYAKLARDLGADPEGVGRFNGVSEDCLYLNVWTPEPGGNARLPVMVWVHGGSNAGGWSYEPNYLGDRLAARGVVVVSLAYRVGPFGFFAHPALANEPGAPIANFGWLDIAEGLRWVRRHIAAFGGDPDNVTLVGESSGAANLLDFAAQDAAAELGMQRLILQSTPDRFGPRRNILQAMEDGEALTSFLGMDTAAMSVDELRAIPAADLLRAVEAVQPDAYYDVILDAVTFLRTPQQMLEQSSLGDIELLIGTNADEWLMYLDPTTRDFDVDHWLFENAPASADLLRNLVHIDGDARKALDRLRTASRMACPSRHLAERVSAAGGRAWVYWFSRVRPGPAAQVGAYHGTEIAYVFDQHEYWQPVDARDRMLTRTVMDYWTAFARTGNPNTGSLPDWPLYRSSRPLVLELGDRVRALPPPDDALCLWLGPGGSSTK